MRGKVVMRLQDLVMRAADVRIQTSDLKIHTMPGANEIAPAVARAPLRYVMDDACVRLVSETAFDEKSMLGEAVDLIRMPSQKIWLEWPDRSVLNVLKETGLNCSEVVERKPRKVGILIESDETGRRGKAHMIWQREDGTAERSPFVAEFDFDVADIYADPLAEDTVRHVRIKGLECLHPFFKCIRYRMAPQWEGYYKRYCSSDDHFDRVINKGLMHVAGDLPFAMAFFLVLSTRTTFEARETSFTRLNAKRAKKGKAPLLDYQEFRLNLTPSERAGASGYGERGPSRLHHVSGHLVRRGDTLFWRRAHLRGSPGRGAILAKTITVTATPMDQAA